eukprot:TRINITY_DN16147_c0_g1_i1.p1 TRINITY_DN16147_c0_g1~~TRINITY_DN16147_c0_g1_i1.p1  ORF type:complete len:634 (-),score=149.74 TRINITY_DN16147_c0_g1_i1:267-2168(-)
MMNGMSIESSDPDPEGDDNPPLSADSGESKESNENEEHGNELLRQHRWEIRKFGLLWGLDMMQQDFDKYLSYFLIASTSSGCHFLDVFTYWFLVMTIVAFPWNFVSGWLTDYMHSGQHYLMSIASFLQLFFLVVEIMLCHLDMNIWIICIVFQLRQMMITQTLSSVWKLVKMRLAVITKKYMDDVGVLVDGDVENIVVSSVGNDGDLFCDGVQVAALGSCFLMAQERFLSFSQLTFVMCCICFVVDLVVLLLSLSFKKKDLVLDPLDVLALEEAMRKTPNQLEKEDSDETSMILISDTMGPTMDAQSFKPQQHQEEHEGEKEYGSEKSPLIVTKKRGISLGEIRSSETSSDAGHSIASSAPSSSCSSASSTDPLLKRSRKSIRESISLMWMYVKVRVIYLWHHRVALNVMIHAILGLLVYCIVEYPITMMNAEDESDDPAGKNVDSYCGNLLPNLLLQGVFLNIMFFVSSVGYAFFLVRCRPRRYFSLFFPVLCLVTIIALAALLLDDLHPIVTFALIAVAQVLPYYFNTFDYYVFTTALHEEIYGFILSIYGFFAQLTSLLTAFLMTTGWSLHVVVLICLGLYFVLLVYGVGISNLFRTSLWAPVLHDWNQTSEQERNTTQVIVQDAEPQEN